LLVCVLACLLGGRSVQGRSDGRRERGGAACFPRTEEGRTKDGGNLLVGTDNHRGGRGHFYFFFLFWRAVPCCVRVSRGTFRCWIVGCSRFWWMLDVGEREKRGLMGQDCGGREDEDAGGWLREDDERRRQAFVGASLSRRKEGEEKKKGSDEAVREKDEVCFFFSFVRSGEASFVRLRCVGDSFDSQLVFRSWRPWRSVRRRGLAWQFPACRGPVSRRGSVSSWRP